jgi:cyclopropane fatty-acyl-phospholipid synthase-like methyltransferase
MVFTPETSRDALEKRKSRFTRINVTAKAARKAKPANKVRVKQMVARQNAVFRNNTASGGASNAMTPASVEAVLNALSGARKLSKNRVVVDFGCGSGNVLVAAVLGYGLKAYGIEKDEVTYQAACVNLKALGPDVTRRIHLFYRNFNEERFGSHWLHEIGATHVVVFDKAFNRDSVESLFETLSGGRSACCWR